MLHQIRAHQFAFTTHFIPVFPGIVLCGANIGVEPALTLLESNS